MKSKECFRQCFEDMVLTVTSIFQPRKECVKKIRILVKKKEKKIGFKRKYHLGLKKDNTSQTGNKASQTKCFSLKKNKNKNKTSGDF